VSFDITMPRKPVSTTAFQPRTAATRASKLLAGKRIIGEAPVEGIVKAPKKRVTKKPSLKKVNSKGEVIKTKRKTHPSYQALIKRCIKQNQSRKGTTRQAILKYIFTNYGVENPSALKRALTAGVASKRIVQVSKGRYNLSNSEKRKEKKKSKKTKKSKKSSKKKSTKSDSKTKSTKKKKSSKKNGKKEKKEKAPKKLKLPKVTKTAPTKKVSKTAPTKKVSKTAPTKKVSTGAPITRGVPKTQSSRNSASSSKTDTTGSGELVWTWQYYDGGFHNYDSAASDTVEGVYQEYLTSPYTCDVRSVQSGQWQYEIDFRLMLQTNIQHESHTKRRIRRIQIPASEKGDRHKNYGGDENYVVEKSK